MEQRRKTNEKWISMVLLFAMVAAIFAVSWGCRENPEDTQQDALKQTLEEVMFAQHGQHIYWKSGAQIYGTFGQHTVFFTVEHAMVETVMTVDSYTFTHAPGGSMWVYDEESIQSLWDAYQSKSITQEQLAEIYDSYRAAAPISFQTEGGDPSRLQAYMAPLTQERIERISEIWRQSKNLKPDWTWDGETGYLGQYNGYAVVFSAGITQAVHGMLVADYRFTCSTGFSIYVFMDSQMLDIRYAYEQGLLTYEHIAMIYTSFQNA